MTATELIDPTKAVGRLLPAGWRVERTKGCEGGTVIEGGDRSTVGPAEHLDECECDDPDDGQWAEACRALNEWVPTLARDEGAHGYSVLTHLPLGAVVAVARFVEALPIVADLAWHKDDGMDVVGIAGCALSIDPDGVYLHNGDFFGVGGPEYPGQQPLGDFRPGRFGWLLDNVRRLPEPIPCTGFQGPRALPDDVTGDVRQAVQ